MLNADKPIKTLCQFILIFYHMPLIYNRYGVRAAVRPRGSSARYAQRTADAKRAASPASQSAVGAR